MPRNQTHENEDHYPLADVVLPDGWTDAFVGEVCVSAHPGFSSGVHNTIGDGIPHLRPMNITRDGRLDLSDVRYVEDKSGERLRVGDVLFNNTNSQELVGKTCWIDIEQEMTYSNHMTRLRLGAGMMPSYIANQLHFLWITGYMRTRCTSHINQASISTVTLTQTIPLRVPPTGEQKRIVTKLDSLLSRLASGEAIARRALARLDRYRAAVLNAALSGDLTQKWRDTHDPVETGSNLLQRLLAERRNNWEQAELKLLQSGGKPPKNDNWQKRYANPSEPITKGLPTLPSGWAWVSVSQASTKPLQNGLSIKGEDIPPGIPALKLDALGDHGIDFSRIRYLPLTASDVEDLWVQEGDFLVTRGNGSIRLVGRGLLVHALPERVIFPDTMIRIQFPPLDPLKRWISTLWLSSLIRNQIETRAKTTAGIYKISQSDLASIALPLPPLAEQTVIVSEIERRLKAADHLAEKLNRQINNARLMHQSLLRDAFSGKLVPQDSNEEPATVLLDRIRQTRQLEVDKPKIKRMRKSRSSPSRRPIQEVLRDSTNPITPEQLFREAGFKASEVDLFYLELASMRKFIHENKPTGKAAKDWPQQSRVYLELNEEHHAN